MASKGNTVSCERYIDAFLRISGGLSEKERASLRAHYHAPAHTASATELARAVGYSQYRATNLIYGRLASKVGELFEGPLPRTHHGIGILLHGHRASPKQHWQLEMGPGLASALEALGWFTDPARADLDRLEAALGNVPETEARALRDSRLGQGRFRASVMDYWRRCAVTGCEALELLAASHIKPWRSSTNAERLDPYNGLLLTPNLHAAFDVGLISFRDDGSVVLSSRADPATLEALGIHSGLRIDGLAPDHVKYIRYHREHVFTQ